jgi:hypothetical protein
MVWIFLSRGDVAAGAVAAGSVFEGFFSTRFSLMETDLLTTFLALADVVFFLVCAAGTAFFLAVFSVVFLVAIVSPVNNLPSVPKQFLFSQ